MRTTRTFARENFRIERAEYDLDTEREIIVPATVDPVDRRTQPQVVVSAGHDSGTDTPDFVSVRIGQGVAVMNAPQRNALIAALVEVQRISSRNKGKRRKGK